MRILKTAIKNLLRTMGFEIVNINDIYTNKALRILDEKKRICWPRLAEVSLTAFDSLPLRMTKNSILYMRKVNTRPRWLTPLIL